METKRPTIPAAEEILGEYFPVLDHGFVSLVDYMGSDEDVERAARVSYGFGTRKVSQTRGLVRYLRRHRHTTPSEMVEFKFHCAMPMFVARQWIRHRTACLAEGTLVHFDATGGAEGGGDQGSELRIETVWERFQSTHRRPDEQSNPDAGSDRVRGMPFLPVQEMRLRQVDEDTRRIQHTRVVDVFRNGRKPVFRMHLEDGKTIESTRDHQFLFADGWQTLAGATDLAEVDGKAVWDRGDYFVQVDGAEHAFAAVPSAPTSSDWKSGTSSEQEAVETLDGPLAPEASVTEPGTPWSDMGEATLVRVDRFEFVGVRETYDIEVEGPFHNFIANGIVTHNSVNELSARYSLMPLLFYMPAQEQFALQSRSNKQGREGGAPDAVYREAVERWERLRSDAGDAYGWMLEEDVAREIARIDLPVSTYTQWYWKIDLHNLLHFLSLRVDHRAQWEIQQFGQVIAAMVKRVAPLSYEAWIDYDLAAEPLTRVEREVLARLVDGSEDGLTARDGATVTSDEMKEMGLSPREFRELVEKVQAPERPEFELDLSSMKSADEMAELMYKAVPGSFE